MDLQRQPTPDGGASDPRDCLRAIVFRLHLRFQLKSRGRRGRGVHAQRTAGSGHSGQKRGPETTAECTGKFHSSRYLGGFWEAKIDQNWLAIPDRI